MDVTFELDAFAKVILHAAKYPAYPVNGLLIRSKAAGGGDLGVIHCEDAIPLTHVFLSKYCTPTMEIALAQVEQQCKDSKSEVVGYYQANQNVEDTSPDFIATRIAEKLHDSNPNLIVVMVNNEQLDSNLETIPFVVYRFNEGKLKIQDRPIRLVPDDQECLATVSALIQAKAYRQLIDFDNHMDNIKEDYWANSKIKESIEQFSSS